MRLIVSAVWATLISQARGRSLKTTEGNNCFACSKISSSAVVTSCSASDGYTDYTIDLTDVKGSALSWVWCKDGACDMTECNAGAKALDIAKGGKSGYYCNEATSVTVSLPTGTSSVTLQVHDGIATGTIDCKSNNNDLTGEYCAGGGGGSCGASSVCEAVINLTCPSGDDGGAGGNGADVQEPECTVDSDCGGADVCGKNACNNGICEVQYFVDTPCGDLPPSGAHCWSGQSKCADGNMACPAPTPLAAGTTCRAKEGDCDIAETCDGTLLTCPSDSIEEAGVTCRAKDGPCDVADKCDGKSKTCEDKVELSGTVCRAQRGGCDVAETCNGVLKSCPTDAVRPQGYVCDTAVLPCEENAVCPGEDSETPKVCPEKPVSASTKTCRDAVNKCDVEEKCDGTLRTCPPDYFRTYGYWLKSSTNIFLCELGGELGTYPVTSGNKVSYSTGVVGGYTWSAGLLDGQNPGRGVRAVIPMTGNTTNAYGIVTADCLSRPVTQLCPADAAGQTHALSNTAFFKCNPSTGNFEVVGTKIEVSSATTFPIKPTYSARK